MQSAMLFGNGRPVDKTFVAFRNSETTPMLRGAPVVLAMNGTNDGVDAIHAVTAGANKCKTNFIGVNSANVAPGAWGLAQVYGLCNFVRASGASSSQSLLVVNSATNDFGPGGASSAVDAVAAVGPSTLSFASVVGGTATVDGVANVAKVFLRCM